MLQPTCSGLEPVVISFVANFLSQLIFSIGPILCHKQVVHRSFICPTLVLITDLRSKASSRIWSLDILKAWRVIKFVGVPEIRLNHWCTPSAVSTKGSYTVLSSTKSGTDMVYGHGYANDSGQLWQCFLLTFWVVFCHGRALRSMPLCTYYILSIR